MNDITFTEEEKEHRPKSSNKFLWLILLFILATNLSSIRYFFVSDDFKEDLVVSEVRTLQVKDQVAILGLLTNHGSKQWSGIKLEAELMNDSGELVADASQPLYPTVTEKGKEHFGIDVRHASADIDYTKLKVIVTVAEAKTDSWKLW